jgi:hypothetical protein
VRGLYCTTATEGPAPDSAVPNELGAAGATPPSAAVGGGATIGEGGASAGGDGI